MWLALPELGRGKVVSTQASMAGAETTPSKAESPSTAKTYQSSDVYSSAEAANAVAARPVKMKRADEACILTWVTKC